MPLILAIEPDRDQASQVNAIVRGRLRAELVLEASAERALAELGDRVPDLILTAALLSPKDEAALAERLRALNSAAAHIHTLTIPVLAAPRSRPRIGGVLSALRREKQQTSELDGCDPAVFADQCATYLERAMEERQGSAHADFADSADIHDKPTPLIHEETTPSVYEATTVSAEQNPSIGFEEFSDAAAYVESAGATSYEYATYAHADEELSHASADQDVARVDDPVVDQPFDRPDARQMVTGPVVEQSVEGPFVEEIADDPAAEDIADVPVVAERRDEVVREDAFEEPAEKVLEEQLAESVAVAEPALCEVAEPPVQLPHPPAASDGGDAILEDSPLFELVNECESEGDLETAEELEKYIELDLSEFLDQSATPILHAVGASDAGKSTSPGGEMDSRAAAAPNFVDSRPSPADNHPSIRKSEASGTEPEEDDWLDVVEALRRDVERLDATPLATTRPGKMLKKPTRKALRTKPIQDEWGFFDPEQCGFAALLAKLDEVSAATDPKRRRKRA